MIAVPASAFGSSAARKSRRSWPMGTIMDTFRGLANRAAASSSSRGSTNLHSSRVLPRNTRLHPLLWGKREPAAGDVVTSAGPAEGKSTVVSNLGIAIAEVNHKTLLIDADLRKPRQHDIFNLKNDRGLSELLRSKDPVATLLEGGIFKRRMSRTYTSSPAAPRTPLPRVCCIPAACRS